MEIEFLGAAGTVTGSRHLLHVGERRLLVDCGLFQGWKELRLRNWEPFTPPAESVDAVVLTHAHIDHIGWLPRLFHEGFHGAVHATRGTAHLAQVMLPDSGRLQEEEAEYHNKRGTSRHHPALPLYTGEDGERVAAKIRPHRYGETFEPVRGARVTFERAGHIVGSATVAVDLGDGTEARCVVFSGDLGRYGAPLLTDPEPIGRADYVVMESTYGDRRHEGEPPPEQLARVLSETADRGGVIVIPAFAVGRTQEILYYIARLQESKRIPTFPTVLDSPLAIEATRVYNDSEEDFDEEIRAMLRAGRSPLSPQAFRASTSVQESKAINRAGGPLTIVAGSGMATGGRVLHHLRNRLPDARNTVLLVGYQANGTRGRRLLEGEKTLRIFGEDVPVRAEVKSVQGLSAHADSEMLLRWLRTLEGPPRRVFLVHGDPEPSRVLAERIRAELGFEVTVPAMGERAGLL